MKFLYPERGPARLRQRPGEPERGERGRRPREGGGRRGRMFDGGQLRLLVLHVLEQQPRHGYDIIRAISELAGGDYSPSPGTIYPTLSALEELEQIEPQPSQDGRRQYRIGDAGRRQLAVDQMEVERILAHLRRHREHDRAQRAPQIVRAMENLKMALRLRLEGRPQDPELLARIAAILDQAAVEVEGS